MNDKNSHNDQHRRFFKKTDIPYSRSKEDVWSNMMAKIQDEKEPERKTRSLIIYWSAAAIFIMFLGITGFMRFYSVSLYAPAGQHLSKTLPEGSKVHLNAGTTLTYHPYWWRFGRILELEGEAYFEVVKGNRFMVRSALGSTEVLGTSFNIYARNNEYKVHCLTGQVRVESDKGKSKILESNQSVTISVGAGLKYQSDVKVENVISWTSNKFVFTSVPLNEVLKEIERQFDITIELETGIEGEYTGNFQRGSSVKNILDMIARPFGLRVEQIHQDKYRLIREVD
ncbi:MAG: FecR family protein [Bacteroidota bacterium]